MEVYNMTLTKHKIKTKGMTCTGCEKIIARQVSKLPGIKSIDVDYTTQITEVRYDDEQVSLKEIKKSEIGLIGHSEGGIISTMIAQENQKISYIILLYHKSPI